MSAPTTAQKLEQIVRRLGLDHLIPEAQHMQRREAWILDAEAILEDKAEREAIQAEGATEAERRNA